LADVFISCSPLDQERVRPVADRLSSLGYSVWQSKHTRVGRAAAEEIDRELEAAQAVLTVWSGNALNSTWVHAQSSRGLDAKKLVQMKIDAITLPPPFDALAIADMTSDRAEWGPLEHTLAGVVRERKAAEPERPTANIGMLATPPASGAPKLSMIATGAVLIAFVGALKATQAGVMTPEQLQLALVGMIGVGGACAAPSAYRLFAFSRC
jgi:hypothetical protein